MITHDTAVGAPPPPGPLCRGPGSHSRDPLGTPRPATRPLACGPWGGSAGVWAPDPRGSRPELAKNRQFLTPYGAKSRGSGGAPPTNLILLRNQRAARNRSYASLARGGAVAGAVGGGRSVGGNVPPGPTHKPTPIPLSPTGPAQGRGESWRPTQGRDHLRFAIASLRRFAKLGSLCPAAPVALRVVGEITDSHRPLPAEPRLVRPIGGLTRFPSN